MRWLLKISKSKGEILKLDYVMAFIIGGIICAIGQVFIDITRLASAYILIIFVVLGVLLSSLGLYQPIMEVGKAGAAIPITGFGHTLASGVIEEVNEYGFIGIFTGALKAGSTGITVAVVFGYLFAIIFNPKSK